jgi:Uma2 family endonuclease
MVDTVQGMTLDEFMELFDKEGPFELFDGERVEVSPNKALHSVTIRCVFLLLYLFVVENKLGEVFQETTFVVMDHPKWVKNSRIPDVMFYRGNRFSDYQTQNTDWGDKPFILIPDMAVEVVSPTDKFAAITRKVRRYLRDGVQLVWVVDPQAQNVTVYRAGSKQQTTLSGDDVLDGGGEIIPGFSVKVAAVFA